MLTLHATLNPDGHVTLPSTLRHDQPVRVLLTFIDDLSETQAGESAKTTLALLNSPEFQSLPKSDPNEIKHRIENLRKDWEDE